MKKVFFVLAVLALAGIGAGTAEAGRWIKGTPYMVGEMEMEMGDLLEQTYDSAYCSGVARFGTQGEFPYEEFVVFDCTVRMSGPEGYSCIDKRYRSVKSSRRGWFRREPS